MAFNLSDKLQHTGIVKSASFNYVFDKDAIAQTMKGGVSQAVSVASTALAYKPESSEIAPDSALEFIDKPNEPNSGTLKIHTDRLVDQLGEKIRYLFKKQVENYDNMGLESFAKIIPHDDGGKYVFNIKKSALEEFIAGNSIEVGDILDRSTIPSNRNEMRELAQQLVGMDGESGRVIVDGQSLLKLLQATLEGKHTIEKDGESVIDKDIEQWKKIAQYIPATQVKSEGDYITLELDMAKLKETVGSFVRSDLNKIQGFNVLPASEEEPTVITTNIDFKTLANQAVKVAGDILKQPGVRVSDDKHTVTVSASTDLLASDNLLANLQQQVNNMVRTLGQEIAEDAKGKTPSSLISSVKTHFRKPEPPKELGQ